MANNVARESASYTCICGHRFRTLADEYGDHPCPKCGYHPADDLLADDVAAYVGRCRSKGVIPDAMAFSLAHQRQYGKTPGSVITELIHKELSP